MFKWIFESFKVIHSPFSLWRGQHLHISVFSPLPPFPALFRPLPPLAHHKCCPTVGYWQKEPPASWALGPHKSPVDRGDSEWCAGRCNAAPLSPDRLCRMCGCSGEFWERGRCGSNAGNRPHIPDPRTAPWLKTAIGVRSDAVVVLSSRNCLA